MVSVNSLRFADRYLGTPLCILLTLLRFVAYPFWRNTSRPAPKRILIIKLSEMGSTVLAYPAIEEIQKRIPDAEIFFLAFENNRAIIDALKLTKPDNVITVDISSAGRLLSTGLAALSRLRREGIDTTIDMDFFSRFSAILAFLVCRGNRVGFHRFTTEGLNRGRLLTHEVVYSTHAHTSVAFMALANAMFSREAGSVLGREMITEKGFPLPVYSPEPQAISRVRGMLREAGLDIDCKDACIVLVNPNSSDLFPLRRWPLNNFSSLSSRLIASRDNVRIVITGTASERPDAEAILKTVRYPQCVSLVGRTTFSELLALYSISSLMITNDSGPAHFAVLASLPAIVLFGPETPALYSPLGGKAKSLYSNFACSPCVSVNNAKASPCKRSVCLEAISVDEVLRCALALLDNVKAGQQSPSSGGTVP